MQVSEGLFPFRLYGCHTAITRWRPVTPDSHVTLFRLSQLCFSVTQESHVTLFRLSLLCFSATQESHVTLFRPSLLCFSATQESHVTLFRLSLLCFSVEQDMLTLLRKMEQDAVALDDVMNTLHKDVQDLRTKCTSCPALNTPAYLKVGAIRWNASSHERAPS